MSIWKQIRGNPLVIKGDQTMKREACIKGVYRYFLTREWDEAKERCVFVMLNPSTADAERDDQTIRKCVKYAQKWGYGSLKVVNLFAYRATNKREIRKVSDPIGEENDHHLLDAAKESKMIICAWGNDGDYLQRSLKVKQSLKDAGHNLYCLRISKKGEPYHPLYQSSDIQPKIWV